MVLIAGGRREYLHFAISTTENIRANGYTGDIFVYLQVEVPDVDGCVASHFQAYQRSPQTEGFTPACFVLHSLR